MMQSAQNVKNMEFRPQKSKQFLKAGSVLHPIQSILLPKIDSLQLAELEPGRPLFVVFTIRVRGRQRFIRPISARYMHAKEIESYEAQNP
jgi:hypothetical protein